MREIKFRAWDENKKKMVPDKELQIMTMPDFRSVPLNQSLEMLGVVHKLMQFTGLLDKNGKEIYEGDIIRIPKQADYKAIWEVDFIRGAFVLTDGIGFRYFYPDSDQFPKEYEVIGNCFENPDLLTHPK